jgi:peptidyl-prolyl cis-trans isomerase C
VTGSTPPRIAVNGAAIAEDAILAEMQHHPAPSAGHAMRAAAEALTVRELLLQEAQRLGLGGPAEDGETAEESAIRRLIEREVKAPDADPETCRRYYENNRGRFRSPDAFEAQHILYAAAPDDAAARLAAKARAQSALERVLGEPALFEKIAHRESDCPSHANAGRLGTIRRGDADPVFETYLMSLADGEICPVPVGTKYGFHVVRLLRRVPGRDLPFEHVRARVAAYLEEAAWRRAVAQYVSILAGRARIEGIELAAAPTPLVQ